MVLDNVGVGRDKVGRESVTTMGVSMFRMSAEGTLLAIDVIRIVRKDVLLTVFFRVVSNDLVIVWKVSRQFTLESYRFLGS